jgi:ABC-type phosphate transport system auxiliary subunit
MAVSISFLVIIGVIAVIVVGAIIFFVTKNQ